MPAHLTTQSHRADRTATISVHSEQSVPVTARLVNHTELGAQVVLQHDAAPGLKVHFELHSRTGNLRGLAQLTWTRRLRSGEVLAGLRFFELEPGAREAA